MAEALIVQPDGNSVSSRLRRWLPGLVSVLMLILAFTVLHNGMRGIQFADVTTHLKSIGLPRLLLAVIVMVCSYLVLTLYDTLALRYIEFPMPWKQVAPTAFSAFAVGHNAGFAALSGGAIRYRS